MNRSNARARSGRRWARAVLAFVALVSQRADGAPPEPNATRSAVERQLREVRTLILKRDYKPARRVLATLERSKRVAPADLSALRGLVDLGEHRFEAALVAFRRALTRRATKVALWLYVAQAHVGLGRHARALAALVRARSVGAKLAGYHLMRGRCHLALGQNHRAYLALEAGLRRFANHRFLLREQTLTLIRLGLYSQALRVAGRFLAAAPRDPNAYLFVGESLRRARQLEDATVMLERGRVRFPGHLAILVRLAHTYAQRRMSATAARLFSDAASLDPRYAFEAAEQLRSLGRHRAALRFNSRVPDQSRKLRQRLAILVGAERWQNAWALAPLLSKEGVDDRTSKLLLAHAALRVGEWGASGRLTSTLGQQAHQLRVAVEHCKRQPSRCAR